MFGFLEPNDIKLNSGVNEVIDKKDSTFHIEVASKKKEDKIDDKKELNNKENESKKENKGKKFSHDDIMLNFGTGIKDYLDLESIKNKCPDENIKNNILLRLSNLLKAVKENKNENMMKALKGKFKLWEISEDGAEFVLQNTEKKKGLFNRYLKFKKDLSWGAYRSFNDMQNDKISDVS